MPLFWDISTGRGLASLCNCRMRLRRVVVAAGGLARASLDGMARRTHGFLTVKHVKTTAAVGRMTDEAVSVEGHLLLSL